MKNITHLALLLFSIFSLAQTGSLKGTITSSGQAVETASILIIGTTLYTKTDSNGKFELLNIPIGNQKIVVSSVGFRRFTQTIVLEENQTLEINFEIQEDLLSIEEVVITGTRSEVPQYRSPVIVSRISSKSFETTQSLSLSEGLNFSPGLRLETNCQNCGFTQIRMNGLEGPYSQILINSRPIFRLLSEFTDWI